MILKLKVKTSTLNNQKKLVVWIQKRKIIEEDVKQLLVFFNDNIKVSKIRKIHSFYKITSNNPAIMLSLFSALQELIPDTFFNEGSSIKLENSINSQI